MSQSLFTACKNVKRNGASGIQDIGGYSVGIELYTQADIDANVTAIQMGEATACTFGDSDESKVVLIADETITIPSGFNLTPAHPKKSLVIMCNTFVNNGTVSMTAKGPNVLPHDWYMIGTENGINKKITIPAYANNQVPTFPSKSNRGGRGQNGNNGTNRNCGSGGTGSTGSEASASVVVESPASGSGYAFGGGAGSGGYGSFSTTTPTSPVGTVYPMRGSDANPNGACASGGVGNPSGINQGNGQWTGKPTTPQNVGVGGRVIIFCNNFTNNGSITANGVSSIKVSANDDSTSGYGGASGGGAVDIFYNELTEEGTVTANGGTGYGMSGFENYSGNGGNGSITLLEWKLGPIIKPELKYFSRDNMVYLLKQFVARLQSE